MMQEICFVCFSTQGICFTKKYFDILTFQLFSGCDRREMLMVSLTLLWKFPDAINNQDYQQHNTQCIYMMYEGIHIISIQENPVGQIGYYNHLCLYSSQYLFAYSITVAAGSAEKGTHHQCHNSNQHHTKVPSILQSISVQAPGFVQLIQFKCLTGSTTLMYRKYKWFFQFNALVKGFLKYCFLLFMNLV